MSEHLHDMDNIFKSAYRQFKEEPTADVWQKINAALNKKDTECYKKRSLKWKRVSFLLLLLLAGLVLYETMIIRTDSGNPKKNSAAIVNIESKKKNDAVSELKDTTNFRQRKIMYGENDRATNQRLFIQNKLPQNVELSKDAEKIPTFFALHTAPISLTQGIKTNYPDAAFFKNVLSPSPLFTDHFASSINNSTNKIQPGQKNLRISWTYTPFVSYEWAQYRIDSDLPAVNSIKQGNEHEPSFSTGVLLSGQFTEKWMFQSGIVYSNTTIDIAPQKIYAVQSPGGDYAYKYITSAGYGYIRPGFTAAPALGDSLLTAEAEHTLRHISVPLMIKYKIGRSKFSIMPGAGIAANFLTRTKVETEIKNARDKETVTITKLTGVRKLNWSLTADAEMQYQLNNKMSSIFALHFVLQFLQLRAMMTFKPSLTRLE